MLLLAGEALLGRYLGGWYTWHEENSKALQVWCCGTGAVILHRRTAVGLVHHIGDSRKGAPLMAWVIPTFRGRIHLSYRRRSTHCLRTA